MTVTITQVQQPTTRALILKGINSDTGTVERRENYDSARIPYSPPGITVWPPIVGQVFDYWPSLENKAAILPADTDFPGIGGGGGSSLPVIVPFSGVPPLNQTVTISSTTISAPVAFSPPAGAVAGSTSYARMIADGNPTNTPTFVGFSQLLGSSGWDNRAGIANLIQFFYDGVAYYYSISQAQGAQPIDTAAPTVVSALLNVAKDKITILYNEPILGAITPAQYTLTGATISATAIVGSAVELTLSPAAVGGTALTLSYTGNTIRDSANNLAATFAGTSIPNAAGATSIPFILANTVTESPAGTFVGTAAGWANIGRSSTALFTGAKTYQFRSAGSSTMIWIDTVDDLADYNTADYGIFWQSGTNFRLITAGALTAVTPAVTAGGPVLMRIVRDASNVLIGSYSLDNGATWVVVQNWGTVTGDFFLKFASNTGIISEVSCA